jgi:hypothetical protein
MMIREEMLNLLREGICYVEFEKKDGTIRKMNCTINQTLIPEDKIPKENVEYANSVIRVFEVPEDQWRSFRVDSVKKFERASL